MWRGWFLLLVIAEGGAALAESRPTPAESRRAAADALRRLVEDSEDSRVLTDESGGRTVFVTTRARASGKDGLCERDELKVEFAPPAPAGRAGAKPSAVRELEAERRFRVVADESDRPRWELAGDALEAACADPDRPDDRWVDSDDALHMVMAVRALEIVKRELAAPDSAIVAFSCDPAEPPACSRSRVAGLVEPLYPGSVWEIASRGCPEDRWCLRTSIDDFAYCGWWEVRLHFERDDPNRLRRAELWPAFGANIACGEETGGE
jgi:hypothetical protein